MRVLNNSAEIKVIYNFRSKKKYFLDGKHLTSHILYKAKITQLQGYFFTKTLETERK